MEENNNNENRQASWWENVPRLGIVTAVIVTFVVFPSYLMVLGTKFEFDVKDVVELIKLWFNGLKDMAMIAVTFHLGVKVGEKIHNDKS
jgi:hypothetical protein